MWWRLRVSTWEKSDGWQEPRFNGGRMHLWWCNGRGDAAEKSSDLICDERSGVGYRWRGSNHERFWSGVWDQLWSSVICQLSLRKLVCIHDYIIVRQQAEVRSIGAVIRRGLFYRCSVTKNLSKKVGGVLEIKRQKSRIYQKKKGKKWLNVLANALIVSLLSKWGNCHLNQLNCGTDAVCDCVLFVYLSKHKVNFRMGLLLTQLHRR